jgi:hypothetical protein
MKKALLIISLVLLLILIPISVIAFYNGGDTGSIAGRWNTEARVFNVKGKPVIYDTTQRSGINVTLQYWSNVVGIYVESMAKSNTGE